MYFTALAFIAVAFLYASVGFGGGSTYTAILIESGLYWELVPPVSLVCNLVVVSGGVYHFAKAGHLNLRFAAPMVATSVPVESRFDQDRGVGRAPRGSQWWRKSGQQYSERCCSAPAGFLSL